MSLENIGKLQTTVGGFVLGALNYWYTVGVKIPQTQDEWAMLVVSMVLSGAGIISPNVVGRR